MKQKIGYQAPGKRGVKIHIAFFALVAILGNVAATQYTAYMFLYDPNLGSPVLGGIYWPWEWMVWNSQFGSLYPETFYKIYSTVTFGLVIVVFLYVVGVVLNQRSSKGHDSLHGTAHWAEKKEIEQSGLLPVKGKDAEGVFVGGWIDDKGELQYLRHNGPEHVLCFAPTRSGKGVSLVLPTLLSWPHSTLVMDIKGENWALTSGWRQKYAGNKVLRFDPTASSEETARACFNFLNEIRIGTEREVSDAQNIANIIVDPAGEGLKSHWDKTSHVFLVGVILHALYVGKNEGRTASLPDVARLLSNPDSGIVELLNEMLSYPHVDGEPHPFVASAARDMANKEEKELSGVLSTAVSFFTIYRDPLVEKNISHSDFTIRDLMNNESPVSLYICLNPSDRVRLKPLARLLVNLILSRNTESMEFANGEAVKSYKHRMLLMLDEFPSLGRLDVFSENLAYIAGYGMKAYLITQGITQLVDAYGRDESITANCHVRNAFAPNKVETAEYISKELGTTTVVKSTRSSSGKKLSAVLGQVQESVTEVSRPLLTADECMRIPAAVKSPDQTKIIEAGDMIVMSAGSAPIYGRQTLFFRDPIFTARSKVPTATESDRLTDSVPVLTALASLGEVEPEQSVEEAAELVEPSFDEHQLDETEDNLPPFSAADDLSDSDIEAALSEPVELEYNEAVEEDNQDDSDHSKEEETNFDSPIFKLD